MAREFSPLGNLLEYTASIPPDFDPEKRLVELTNDMGKYQSEFVLVVTRNWHTISCGLKPELYTIDEMAYLGIITPPFILDKDFDIEIETPKHAVIDFDINRIHLEPKLASGSIQGWGIFKYELELPLERKTQEEGAILAFKEPGLALQIKVGDEAVRNWFEEKTREHLPEGTESLEEQNPELFREIYSNYIRIEALTAFSRAADMLGRPLVEEPKEVTEFIEKQKLTIVGELLALKQKEDKILAKLAEIQGMKAPKLGDGIHFADVDKTTAQDYQDLKIIKSIKPTEELNSVRRQIESTLEKAFELKLHHTDWEISQELQSGVTQKINVKRFIHSLCQFYEIPIPQESP